jgi:hypothetical protein
LLYLSLFHEHALLGRGFSPDTHVTIDRGL